MQLKSLTILAFSAMAMAQSANPTEVSVLQVLATALPSSLLAVAATNPAALGSIISSEFAAGQTPAWYSALPPDVKSYLPILASEELGSTTMLASPTGPVSVQPTSVGNATSMAISASIGSVNNSTVVSSVHPATLTTTGGAAGASSTKAAASSSSSGGASYPTAVVGAGIAGAIGFLGMLAL
ncbi:hypothetical protein K432DRAFT_386698 [Lepidopterella palustris CBS 459.81]|uniref:Uncharacterized protein n=1 Tax=Lepidopterella palustris CBS 459.81 TaxID=1314670 RepID=A0A8E2J9U8_9PEZI|nr:hypothetical protein K432DRAFT_386698 [Lepidopterella palustris CBS 459.81]